MSSAKTYIPPFGTDAWKQNVIVCFHEMCDATWGNESPYRFLDGHSVTVFYEEPTTRVWHWASISKGAGVQLQVLLKVDSDGKESPMLMAQKLFDQLQQYADRNMDVINGMKRIDEVHPEIVASAKSYYVMRNTDEIYVVVTDERFITEFRRNGFIAVQAFSSLYNANIYANKQNLSVFVEKEREANEPD